MRALLKAGAEGLNGLIGHRGYRILKTGGWALTAKICAAINLFICVPFVLEALGQRHFGAWAAVVSVITLSNFLDFGLGNGAMNLIAGAKGGNRPEQISAIIASAYSSLLKTTAVLTLSFLAVPFLPWHRLLGLPMADADISMASVAIVLFAVLATIPLSLANKLQLGLGIGGKAFRWQAAGQLLTAGTVIALAKSGYGLPALVAGSALVPLSALLMNTRELLKSLPKMDNTLHADSQISRQIRHEGALFFILQLCAALAFSLDLLLITALSTVVLREKVRAAHWVAIALGMVGVLVALRPSQDAFFTLGALAVLAAAGCYAVSAITGRMLTRTDSSASLVFWTTTLLALGAGTLAWPQWVSVAQAHWPLVAGLAVTGFAGQLAITEAFRHGQASVVAPFEYTALAWGMGLDWVLWQTVPGYSTLLGGAIIIGSGLYLVRQERTQAVVPP